MEVIVSILLNFFNKKTKIMLAHEFRSVNMVLGRTVMTLVLFYGGFVVMVFTLAPRQWCFPIPEVSLLSIRGSLFLWDSLYIFRE